MPFPVSIDGSVYLQRSENGVEAIEKIGSRIEFLLKKESASSVWREGASVGFKVSMFRLVSRWNILGPLDFGTLRIEHRPPGISIAYCVSTKRMLLAVSLVCAALFAFVTLTGGRNRDFLVVLFAWVPLFGVNYLLAAYRFPRWIKRNLDGYT